MMAKAAAIVSMGGYNTFCEILSFDKRALIVPAVEVEQYIRASRAQELGMIDMLVDDGDRDVYEKAAACGLLRPAAPLRGDRADLACGLDRTLADPALAGCRWIVRR